MMDGLILSAHKSPYTGMWKVYQDSMPDELGTGKTRDEAHADWVSRFGEKYGVVLDPVAVTIIHPFEGIG